MSRGPPVTLTGLKVGPEDGAAPLVAVAADEAGEPPGDTLQPPIEVRLACVVSRVNEALAFFFDDSTFALLLVKPLQNVP